MLRENMQSFQLHPVSAVPAKYARQVNLSNLPCAPAHLLNFSDWIISAPPQSRKMHKQRVKKPDWLGKQTQKFQYILTREIYAKNYRVYNPTSINKSKGYV